MTESYLPAASQSFNLARAELSGIAETRGLIWGGSAMDITRVGTWTAETYSSLTRAIVGSTSALVDLSYAVPGLVEEGLYTAEMGTQMARLLAANEAMVEGITRAGVLRDIPSGYVEARQLASAGRMLESIACRLVGTLSCDVTIPVILTPTLPGQISRWIDAEQHPEPATVGDLLRQFQEQSQQ
jgi:hypothetical protein